MLAATSKRQKTAAGTVRKRNGHFLCIFRTSLSVRVYQENGLLVFIAGIICLSLPQLAHIQDRTMPRPEPKKSSVIETTGDRFRIPIAVLAL